MTLKSEKAQDIRKIMKFTKNILEKTGKKNKQQENSTSDKEEIRRQNAKHRALQRFCLPVQIGCPPSWCLSR